MAEAAKTLKPDSDRQTHTRGPQPGMRAGHPGSDARRGGEQLKRNQEHLGVGADHRTEAMKKHRRGTFP